MHSPGGALLLTLYTRKSGSDLPWCSLSCSWCVQTSAGINKNPNILQPRNRQPQLAHGTPEGIQSAADTLLDGPWVDVVICCYSCCLLADDAETAAVSTEWPYSSSLPSRRSFLIVGSMLLHGPAHSEKTSTTAAAHRSCPASMRCCHSQCYWIWTWSM